jgi:UDP-glucose 4-epimerase
MTVLVTGGAGYIGSHVVRHLTEAGYRVIVIDNLSAGFADALIHGEQLIVGDLADISMLQSVFRAYKFKTVLHFAASIIAPESVDNPLKYYKNNTCNTLNLLTVCMQFAVKRVIFSSSAAVYGTPESGIASEETPTNPINPYGTSKLMSEWMLRDCAHAYDLNYVILRYFNVAGADPLARMGQRTQNATHLIKVCCQAALGVRPAVSIFGTDYPSPDGTGIRDYVHIEDLASAHLAALHYLESTKASATLNVGYGKGSSVREVIDMVRQVSKVSFPVTESVRRQGDPAILVAQAEAIHKHLKWHPKYADLQTIIADTWRWEQKLFQEAK